MQLSQLFYYANYGFRNFILRKPSPLLAGIALTDVCNLRCQHCVVNNSGRGHEPFALVQSWMDDFYHRGARILYLQGGEPRMWRDGEKELNDVIAYARKLGFFRVAVATNGTQPLDFDADLIWVSVDGLPETHNAIRKQDIFQDIEKNLRNSKHPSIFANLSINTLNVQDVEAVIRYINGDSPFKAVSVNFHTPYPGVEHLCLPLEERAKVIDLVLALKKSGLKVLNSSAALLELRAAKHKRPSTMIEMVDHGQHHICCFGRDPKVCERCGYGIIAELSATAHLRPSAIMHAMSLFR